MSMIHNIIHTSYNRMHGHGAVRYAMYAVTITKLELLRTNSLDWVLNQIVVLLI